MKKSYKNMLNILIILICIVGIGFIYNNITIHKTIETKKIVKKHDTKKEQTINNNKDAKSKENKITEPSSTKQSPSPTIVEQTPAPAEPVPAAMPVKPVPAATEPTIKITNRSADDHYADVGEIVATLSIPKLGMTIPVINGDSQANLDSYESTIKLNQRVNANMSVIIAGHNYKQFGNITQFVIGDLILIHTYYGDFTFKVSNTYIGITDDAGNNVYTVDNKEIIDFKSHKNKLVLYTCYGDNPNGRFVVDALLI